jgi:hypothetical protein
MLLDTGPLILLMVGRTNPAWIVGHKRADQWTARDYRRLEAHLAQGAGLVVLPHVAAETSNLLAAGVSGERKRRIFETFRCFLNVAKEIGIASKDGASSDLFLRLGLADSIIEATALRHAAIQVITSDLTLHQELVGRGAESLNFNVFVTSE